MEILAQLTVELIFIRFLVRYLICGLIMLQIMNYYFLLNSKNLLLFLRLMYLENSD